VLVREKLKVLYYYHTEDERILSDILTIDINDFVKDFVGKIRASKIIDAPYQVYTDEGRIRI